MLSSATSCTAGSAPEELADITPTECSERDEARIGSDLSEKEIANDVVLPGCRSGDVVPGALSSGDGDGEPRRSTRSRAGSELEWPTSICPDRKEDVCDLLPSDDLCEELCDKPLSDLCEGGRKFSFKSLLQRGQNVALMNHRSTHFAWKTWEQSSTRQMSGTSALNVSWQIAQRSCLQVCAKGSVQTTSLLCWTKASGSKPRGITACERASNAVMASANRGCRRNGVV